MVVALLLIGIVSGLGASGFALLSGMGLLAAFCAYVLGGMGGMILGLLASLPFMRGNGNGPTGPTPAPAMARTRAIA
ncbi:MAG: hypothetical protein ACU0D1_02025 [Pseudooceanicola nanhaiensis]